MRRRRQGRMLAHIGAVLGLCAAGAGCQSTLFSVAPSGGMPSGTTVSAKVRAAAPAEEAPPSPTAPAVTWRKVARPSDPSPEALVPAGYPTIPASPAHVPEPPGAGKPGDVELPPPRPLGAAAAPSARLVPHVGSLVVTSAPHELAKQALPPYIIEPPDILLVEAFVPAKDAAPPGVGPLKYEQPIRGQHLVRPDGTISLGIYGSVYVGGKTIEEARQAITDHLRAGRLKDFKIEQLNVDVLAYNSKFYYVITDGGGYGEQVYPFPFTGSETVLDALGRINGLPGVADKRKVWVARRGPGNQGQILPVDWVGVTQRGGTLTNFQLKPGDRIYVDSDKWISKDAWLAKRLSPIERILGATLLGGEAVNAVRGRTGTR